MALVCALAATSAYAAPVTLTGTVTDEDTGKPVSGLKLGAVRAASLTPGDPTRTVPVELSAYTNASGVFLFQEDSTTAGLEKVLIFTQASDHANELYRDVPFVGQTPTYADADKPTILQVDCRGDVQGVDFALKPVANPAKTTHMLPMRRTAPVSRPTFTCLKAQAPGRSF